jgi:hypothetical protein
MEGLFTQDAQAACAFNFSASKFSPFFHKVSVMAAILRASVRRAMVRLDAFRKRGLVEVLERSRAHTGHGGRTFEETFQIMVMVFVQAPNTEQFLRTPDLTFYNAIFRAGAGLQGQSAVSP